MKTKEQKRQEAQERVDKKLTERLEIGAIQQFRNRLEEIKKRPGKSQREVERLTRLISEFEQMRNVRNVAQMPTIEAPEKSTKKSKGGK